MAIGTIDSYQFIPLSVTLTLAGSQKVSTKQNLGFIFSHTFLLIGMKFDSEGIEAMEVEHPDTTF